MSFRDLGEFVFLLRKRAERRECLRKFARDIRRAVPLRFLETPAPVAAVVFVLAACRNHGRQGANAARRPRAAQACDFEKRDIIGCEHGPHVGMMQKGEDRRRRRIGGCGHCGEAREAARFAVGKWQAR